MTNPKKVIPIEQTQIKGLSVGKFFTIMATLLTMVISGAIWYSNIMNSLDTIREEMRTQKEINFQSDQQIRNLVTKMAIIETRLAITPIISPK